MFEILLLVLSIPGIANIARGRGGRPWLWGLIAAASYIVALTLARVLSINIPFTGWAGIGLVAVCVRFFMGRGMAQPQSMWICKACTYTNGRHAVLCEACKAPYSL